MGATVSSNGQDPSGNGRRPEPPGGADPADPEARAADEAGSEAIAAAGRFFSAIADSDHRALWAELGEDARNYVINLALERGMDFDFASRLRDGTAGEEEFDEYTRDLLSGLRSDISNVDLSRLAFEATVDPHAPDQVRVTYLVQMSEAIGDVRSAIPAGSLLMAHDGAQWKVERLVPRPG